jgi:hypothetical protein
VTLEQRLGRREGAYKGLEGQRSRQRDTGALQIRDHQVLMKEHRLLDRRQSVCISAWPCPDCVTLSTSLWFSDTVSLTEKQMASVHGQLSHCCEDEWEDG